MGWAAQDREGRRDNGHGNKMDWFGLIGRKKKKKKTSAMSTHRINTSYKFNMPTIAL